MSSAAFNPAQAGPHRGATAASGTHHPHRLGDALRAVKVFASAAFGVIVLGEYAEEAGVIRHWSLVPGP
ncbi:hypothetical protein NLX86_29240 [Streptomyces sp. A3M-1-3]|uniref:hypothetical protein n=1 Tax=Streptomyces sp. A3M-1-3 TaxID=2962044 RepID=UPI0020B6B623|nr:hypothetical protein [Streptomyces sp. A3M-1-3]MCP3822021.1 hypothetical protein [Streptomyces sp. A3M-1-3]